MIHKIYKYMIYVLIHKYVPLIHKITMCPIYYIVFSSDETEKKKKKKASYY